MSYSGGDIVLHYRILGEIGRGDMGVVYKAEDTLLKRIVALKFLLPHFPTRSAGQERFLQDARAAASLNHPSICSIHLIGEHEGKRFIDMEYVDGVTLF